jgi:hypothetical protein
VWLRGHRLDSRVKPGNDTLGALSALISVLLFFSPFPLSFKRFSAKLPSTSIYHEEYEEKPAEQMNPFVSFVILVVQSVTFKQTWPFRLTAIP